MCNFTRRNVQGGQTGFIWLRIACKVLRHTEWWGEKSSSCGSQWLHLNDINLCGISSPGGHVQMAEVITCDDENDGGGAEGHLLLGSVPGATRPGHDDWSYGPLDRSQGALFETALQPREARAEKLEQTAPKL